MKIKYIVILLLIIAPTLSFSQNQVIDLSPKGDISLLTFDPGEQLYEVFGHSAVRVKDPVRNIDVVYNYGTFDFDAPNFYLKFIRGQLDYFLSLAKYDAFKRKYIAQKREIREQVLNLTHKEANKLFHFLQKNYLPENRYYRYDFFFDNCATRIRDILPKVFGDRIHFSDSFVKKERTFRDLLDLYLTDSPWSHFGINVILGKPTDNRADFKEHMFLPDYLEKGYGSAYLSTNGSRKPLVKKHHKIFSPKQKNRETSSTIPSPSILFWSIFTLIALLTFYEIYTKKRFSVIDGIFFLSSGLLGALIIFLWFFTDHTVTVKNWNILWTLPTNIIAGVFLFKNSKNKILGYYMLVVATIAVLLFPFWEVIPQRFDLRFIPLILITVFRGGRAGVKLLAGR